MANSASIPNDNDDQTLTTPAPLTAVSDTAVILALCGTAMLGIKLNDIILPLYGLIGKAFDFAQFLFIGLLFPVILLAYVGISSQRQPVSPAIRNLAFAVAAYAVIALCALAVQIASPVVILIGAIESIAIGVGCYLAVKRGEDAERPFQIWTIIAIAAVSIGSWAAMSRLFFWYADAGVWIATPVGALVTLAALALSFWYIYPSAESKPQPKWVYVIEALPVVIIFAMAASRNFGLFHLFNASLNWMVWVSPAENVRHGGWLLWDTPSQYGFLDILALAAMPFRSAWNSVSFASTFSFTLEAAFLYWILRRERRGVVGFVIALLVSCFMCMILSGRDDFLSNPRIHAASVGWRYFCSYIVLWIVFRYEQSSKTPGDLKRTLILGNIVWVIGVLWSSDTAATTSAVWIPAYAILALNPADQPSGKRLDALAYIRTLSAPILLLAIAVAGICVVYLIGLGHLPDAGAFIDYSRAFKNGVMALPIDPSGDVWALVVPFLLSAICFFICLRRGADRSTIAMLISSAAFAWGPSSYYASRSSPTVALSLMLNGCFAVAAVLRATSTWKTNDPARLLLRTPALAVIAAIIIMPFSEPIQTMQNFLSTTFCRPVLNIDTLRDPIDPEALALMKSAGVKETDAFDVDGAMESNAIPAPDGKSMETDRRSWTPIFPIDMVTPLDPERVGVYIDRFAARRHGGGWLLSKNGVYEPVASIGFYPFILKDYSPTKSFSSVHYTLTWFDHR